MEKIIFLRQDAYKTQCAVVKENRTWEQTRQQVTRLINNRPTGRQMNIISDVSHRTQWALEADGRMPPFIVKTGVKLIKKEKI